MKQEVLVLFVRPYNFKDESGRMLEGVTVYYLNNVSTNDAQSGFGYQPIKANIHSMDGLSVVPGVYQATFSPFSSSRGLQLKLSSLAFKEGVELWKKPLPMKS